MKLTCDMGQAKKSAYSLKGKDPLDEGNTHAPFLVFCQLHLFSSLGMEAGPGVSYRQAL